MDSYKNPERGGIFHTLVKEQDNKFIYLDNLSGPILGGFSQRYLCGLKVISIETNQGWYSWIKYPGRRAYWSSEEDYIPHQDGAMYAPVNCLECIAHPRFPLLQLKETKLL